MDYFWAIDYVDENECELVLDDQLYASKQDAIEALMDRKDRDFCEVEKYNLVDLGDVFDSTLCQWNIDTDLRVHMWY